MGGAGRAVVMLGALGLTGISCGETSADLSMAQFNQQYPDAYCLLLNRCCGPVAPQLDDRGNVDVGLCRRSMQEMLTRSSQAVRERLAPLHFDGARAAACVARLKTLSCEDLVRSRTGELLPPLGCDDVYHFRPTRVAGAVCSAFYDCVAGLTCAQPEPDQLGECRPIAEVPGACPPCVRGAYCDSSTNGVCRQGAADGTECIVPGWCASKICWGADPAVARPGKCGVPAGACRGG